MPDLRKSLDYALLGLLAGSPSSGYDLRKLFQTTPISIYSDSPGSVYPALARLERRRWIGSRASSGGRRRRVYELRAGGRAALKRWIGRPLTIDDVSHGTGDVDLRLAFFSEVAPELSLADYLESYARVVVEYRGKVDAVRRAIEPLQTRSSSLALNMGLSLMQARVDWCRAAAKRERHK